MKQAKPRIKPEFKLADEFLGLRNKETNVIIQQLEENMRIREMPIEKQLLRRAKQR